jgi:KaiC/GvpD/RAD55 family RecA-like ATPase
MVLTSSFQATWFEVNKSNPCPLCQKPDWCYLAENGEAVVCGRTEEGEQPQGWRYVKEAEDGRPIFAIEHERELSFSSSYPIKTRQKSKTPKTPSLPSEKIELAKFSKLPIDQPKAKANQVPLWLQEKGIPARATETKYFYSLTQWVSRFEWQDPNHPKGHDKTIRQCHRKTNGKVKWSKGDKEWLPYRMEEAIGSASAQGAIANGKNKWVLGLEGETCVEAARSLGLVAITWQGSSWSTEELTAGLTKLKDSEVKGLVYLPDNDEPGRKKAELVVSAAYLLQFPVLVIEASAIWKEMPPKGDLSDWMTWGKEQGMNQKDLSDKLTEAIEQTVKEQAIKKTVEAQKMKVTSQPSPNKSERLKLEIQAYLQSPDIFDKVRIKGEICSHYRINAHDFNLLCQALEKQNSTPMAPSLGFNEFINQGTDALEWIVPGILPKGETVLLAAQAKTGKTLLSTDIAYAVLSGDRVIGESPGVKGRVLLISSDESANSTRRRLRARGFDLLPESSENLRIMTHLDLSDLSLLEKELEDFRPQLVIIDSLTSITRDSGISEKDAEFAKPIYKLKEMLSRYGAAGILIHHLNKDKEAKGINKVSGSARIVAAVWGVWQMSATDSNNDKNPTRWLKVKPREGESTTLTLDINPKDLWASQGIFEFVGEFGDESGEKRTQGERVLELLRKFSPRGLEYQEIDRYLNVGKSLYTVLDRLEDRQLITKRRSRTDARRWVYCLPRHTTEEDNATENEDSTSFDSLPSTFFSSHVKLVPESDSGKEIEDIQHLVNNHSTFSQHPPNVELVENVQTVQQIRDTKPQEFIQHTAREEGERGVVEQTQSERVLQHEQIANSSTITQQDTSSQINSLDQTSQQEAFQQKYQSVEVLNGEGEWISGYFVHKCLVVANLKGIERKWALIDEKGEKYVFLGEIRLPRGK